MFFSSLTELVSKLKPFSVCASQGRTCSTEAGHNGSGRRSALQNPLRVTFSGEPGIDSGALMKEFLTGMFCPYVQQCHCINLCSFIKYSHHFLNLLQFLCLLILIIFSTEMMAGIEAKFFEGGNSGKNMKYSITEFQNDNCRYVY